MQNNQEKPNTWSKIHSVKNSFNSPILPNKKLKVTIKFANYELSLIEAANELHIPILEYFVYLIRIKEPELKELLNPILFQFGVDETKETKFSLQSVPENIQKEYLLLSLTYRVSFKNLSKIIGCSVEDIIYSFLSFTEYFKSVNYLFVETMYESELSEKLAFSKAKEYHLKRNRLLKAMNEKEEEKEKLKQEIKLLQQEINDTFILNIRKKDINEFTLQEKDAIAMYPIKYNLSLRECADKLSISKNFITKCQNNLAERKPIFAEKLNLFQAKSDSLSISYIEDKIKNSRGGGSR